MSTLVDTDVIEQIVGRPRHQSIHYGKAVTGEKTIHVLHSQACLDYSKDLRQCRYSQALDNGIDQTAWARWQNKPVILCVINGKLLPINARRNNTN